MLVEALTSTSSPGPMPAARDRELQRRGAAGHRDAVLAAAVRRELALELRDGLAEGAGDLAAAQRGDDRGDLFLADVGLEDRNHS